YCAITGGQEVLRSGRDFGWRAQSVGHVYNFSIEKRSAMHVVARERDREAGLVHLGASRVGLGKCGGPQRISIGKRDENGSVGEDLQPALHDRIEYRLRVRGRTADQLENIGSRGLLL